MGNSPEDNPFARPSPWPNMPSAPMRVTLPGKSAPAPAALRPPARPQPPPAAEPPPEAPPPPRFITLDTPSFGGGPPVAASAEAPAPRDPPPPPEPMPAFAQPTT